MIDNAFQHQQLPTARSKLAVRRGIILFGLVLSAIFVAPAVGQLVNNTRAICPTGIDLHYDTRFAPAAWRWIVRYHHDPLFLRGRVDVTTLQPVGWEWFQLSGDTPVARPHCGLVAPVVFDPTK